MSKIESLLVYQLKDSSLAHQAFSFLVEEYQERVYYSIRRMLIDHDDTNDVVQQAFIKAWQKREQFEGQSSFFTWIYRIATNEALQHLRKRKRTLSFQKQLESELLKSVSKQELSADEVQLQLEKALLQLPDKQRLVFNLKYFDDLSYQQIAEITSTSVGALKASYHLAVKKIEDYINENGNG